MTNPGLTILIPVFNEQKTLLKILDKTTHLNIDNYEVIVVDDCSTDNSSNIISKYKNNFHSKKCKLTTIRHEHNMGKGSGIKTALKVATGKYFVVQDADLEYDPHDIEKMFEIASSSDMKVLYGSRFLGNIKTMPKPNYIANKGYNILLRFLYDTDVTDMHTCYKMIKTSLIKSFNMQSAGFEYATELIGNILSRGIEVNETPISFHGRTKKEGKKIDFKDGLVCSWQLIRDYLVFRGYLGELKVMFKFLIVGSIGFITNYLTLTFMQENIGINTVLIASTISTYIAINVTFLLHDRWTYKTNSNEQAKSKSLKRRYITYIVSNIIGAVLTVAIISALIALLGFERLAAVAVASLIVLLWNYTVNKIFIWKIVPKNDVN